jgi:hypothetical protein
MQCVGGFLALNLAQFRRKVPNYACETVCCKQNFLEIQRRRPTYEKSPVRDGKGAIGTASDFGKGTHNKQLAERVLLARQFHDCGAAEIQICGD